MAVVFKQQPKLTTANIPKSYFTNNGPGAKLAGQTGNVFKKDISETGAIVYQIETDGDMQTTFIPQEELLDTLIAPGFKVKLLHPINASTQEKMGFRVMGRTELEMEQLAATQKHAERGDTATVTEVIRKEYVIHTFTISKDKKVAPDGPEDHGSQSVHKKHRNTTEINARDWRGRSYCSSKYKKGSE